MMTKFVTASITSSLREVSAILMVLKRNRHAREEFLLAGIELFPETSCFSSVEFIQNFPGGLHSEWQDQEGSEGRRAGVNQQ